MKTTAIFLAVFIAVSISSYSQQTITLQPGPADGRDSYLNSYYYTAHGDYTNLFAIAWTHSGDFFAGRGIFQFDLSDIPANSTILDARLSLYYASNPNMHQYHYGDNECLIERVIEDWDEATATWYNQPTTTALHNVRLPASTDPYQDYENIDVTALVTDMVEYPESSFGFMLRLKTEAEYRSMMFASSDYAVKELRPKLVITYLECIAPEAGFSFEVLPEKVSFTDQSSSAESWLWDFGDGEFSLLQHPEHSYAAPGEYLVCLTVADTCGVSTFCDTVKTCTPSVASFSYQVTQENTVLFVDLSTNASAWWWDFGDGFYSSLQNPEHFYGAFGTYFVCLTMEGDCGPAVFCDSVDFCLAPAAAFSYETSGRTVFFSDSSGGAVTWLWEFGNGFFSTLQNPVYSFEEDGDYWVCLTVENDCAGDRMCDTVFIRTSSVGEAVNGNFRIFPNPADDFFYLSVPSQGRYDLSVTNSLGVAVLSQGVESSAAGIMKVSVESLPPGAYCLKINFDESVITKKLIIY